MKIHSLSLFTLGLVGLVAAAATPQSAVADALPTVDLGYGVYQASINVSLFSLQAASQNQIDLAAIFSCGRSHRHSFP